MAFEQLPGDPMMLLSVVNTKLRDSYVDLQAMCEDLEADEVWIKEKLKAVGYEYNQELNRFV
ncbi:MAG: DUF4250 domain-containing protein [Lachnospiraceae bacterium]|nr:DUF4250 domain-containing protein [Lachnospiraceae bacterium]